MDLWIKNGRLIDPANGVDAVQDVVVSDGRIVESGEVLEQDCRVIDARGMWVVPGLIDLHVHLREPGYEYKETIATGARSAAAGGFTSICCMPNTHPVIDSPEGVEFVFQQAKEEFYVNIIPVASVTKGQKGEDLIDIEHIVQAGAMALSEDGKTVANAQLLKEALIQCKKHNIPMLSHCEDMKLVNGGCMNEGTQAQKLGLKGISNDSEEVIVARDIVLAESVGAKLHICHISTAGSCALLRDAKKRGADVSGEAAPHHFVLDDSYIDGNNANFKMSPPLRSKKDVQAILDALADGTIEVIATDHAPHHASEKYCGFEKAANGIIGLETAVGLGVTYLVNKNVLTPTQLIEKMSVNPARIIGIDKGHLSVGSIADITIIDPNEKWTVQAEKLRSKSENTPFDGWELQGMVKYTIVKGKVWEAEKL